MAEKTAPNGSSPAATAAAAGGVAVVDPQYCAPYPVEVVIKRKSCIPDRFEVTNANGDLLFKVEADPWNVRDKRTILDAAGNVILTFQQKLWSKHGRWQAFRGASLEPRDLIFTTKLSPLMQWKTKFNVYLANNSTGEEFCDFKLKAGKFGRSCVVYAGESDSTIVAQMQNKATVGRSFLGKDEFMVTMSPNTDSAFIVALLVILDTINTRIY